MPTPNRTSKVKQLPLRRLMHRTMSIKPAQAPIFPILDSIRAVAALGVFVYHANHLWSLPEVIKPLASHGNAGVPVFFGLSGFLVYRPLASAVSRRSSFSPRRFYLRRARRIVPAYWFALTILALFPGLPRFHDRWWQLYLFGQGFDPRTVFDGGIGAAWSLCIEVTFYLLLPAYTGCIRKIMTKSYARWWHELLILAGMASVSLTVHAALARTDQLALLGFTLPGTFYLFASGMALAVVSARTNWLDGIFLRRYPSAFWILALCLYVGASYIVPADQLGSVHPLYGVIAVCVLIPAISRCGPRLMSFAAWRPLRWMGVISYAFYLWHYAVLQVARQVTSSSIAMLAVAFAATCLISIYSYMFIERPFMLTSNAYRRLDKEAFAGSMYHSGK
jgi:peptidoglycan/LPS O-acetylase OafA/YrhL